jgi:hypothetical protein
MLLAARPVLGTGAVVGLGVLVWFQSLASVVYITVSLVVPLGLLALVRLGRARTRPGGMRLVAALAVAGILLAPIVLGYLRVRAANPGIASQSAWGPLPDLPSFRPYRVAGAVVSPLVVPWWSRGNAGPLGVPQAALALVAAGALLAVWRRRSLESTTRRAWAQGALWSVVGVLMSTFTVSVPGGAPHRLPHTILLEPLLWPVMAIVRDPGRLAIAALIALAVLSGLAFAECARGLRRRVAVLALVAAFTAGAYAEYRRFVVPVYPLSPPPALGAEMLAAVRAQPGPLLELPIFADGRDILMHAKAMFRSTLHWRPLLNGYASFWPAGFETRMALASRLPDAEALAALRRETGLTGILVHTRSANAQSTLFQALAAAGDRADVRLVARDSEVLLFAIGADP